jgi:DNA-binding NarL/FixJ family response regulator
VSKSYRTIRIILADDHELFRDGFHSLLLNQDEIELVGEAANGEQLLSLVSKHLPDVILTDIDMPVMDGITATQILTQRHPEVGVIALTMFGNDRMIIKMLEAGAKGYLLKNANKSEMLEAIKTVSKHQHYYCSNTSPKLAQLIATSKYKPDEPSPKPLLTEKENEIVCLICQELSNRDISKKLHLSIRTVESYRERILQKTNAKNTAGIVVFAVREGIWMIDPDK